MFGLNASISNGDLELVSSSSEPLKQSSFLSLGVWCSHIYEFKLDDAWLTCWERRGLKEDHQDGVTSSSFAWTVTKELATREVVHTHSKPTISVYWRSY